MLRKVYCDKLPGSSSPTVYIETLARGTVLARTGLFVDNLFHIARDTDRLRAFTRFTPRPTADENLFSCTISGELFDKQ